MKILSMVLVMVTLTVTGCASRQTAQYDDAVPENNFKGIVELDAAKHAPFMRDVQLAAPLAADVARPDPALMNYSWFYTRGETYGQHLDAWAHKFAFRFESRIPLGYDPYVQSDGSFTGSLYSALEDLSTFSDEGKASFHQYRDSKRLRTKSLQITVYEKQRYIRVELRNPAAEMAEAERDEKERRENEKLASKSGFLDFFRSAK